MTDVTPITIAYGDGIGPEIMKATLEIIQAAGAKIETEEIKVGFEIYESGISSGIEDSSWNSLRKNKVFLKAPITTPLGSGFKSLNVTIRKTLGLYSNVRPCVTYNPFVSSKHNMNVVVIRENEEDLYGGIEHQQTGEVVQCLKLISEPGCERIARYAFEYARRNQRKKVTCFTKNNIMKLTDGLFHNVFRKIAEEYPDIETEHMIIDIGTARLADTPEIFDLILVPNLYGDIISDVAAQIAGSVGLAGSANIGDDFAMFEAIHGSAPDIAGQGIANPSGLILGAVMMLVHIKQNDVATKVHNAWLKTIEDGIHTGDVYKPELSKEKVGTEGFTKAVIERLGQKPEKLPAVDYSSGNAQDISMEEFRYTREGRPKKERELVGVDVFTCSCPEEGANKLAEKLQAATPDNLKLALITNRGTKVWPDGFSETFCTDHWRCRFKEKDGNKIELKDVVALLDRLEKDGIEFVKTEHLYNIDGKAAYSKGQGE